MRLRIDSSDTVILDELRRMAYLQAMGVDSYVSRAQVPGAAPTRRLAIVPAVPEAVGALSTQMFAQESVAAEGRAAEGRAAKGRTPEGRTPAGTLAELDDSVAPAAVAGSIARAVPAAPSAAGDSTIAPFSMTAVIAGRLLWLEDLEGRPLAREQVHLIQAMSRALVVAGTSPPVPDAEAVDVSQFDWPMHNNRQLGLGRDAAAASLAGFVGRRLENNCYGLVVLGRGACSLVPLDQLDCGKVVNTSSTASILSSPELKPQVWRDLLSLLTP